MPSLSVLISAWILAFIIDFFFGEWPNRWHPVAWMGHTIKFGEKIFLGRGPRMEFFGGILLVLIIPAGFAWLSWFTVDAFEAFPWAQVLVATFWLKSSFALKALGGAAEEVRKHLATGNIQQARAELRSLCSRNASHLSEEEVTEAAISSLAENISDSVIAPWFFAALFGIPGAIFYRAINTMDAMIGYKNHYKNLGCGAARIDDVLNLIPARLSTLFLLAVAKQPSVAWSIARRDHALTPSPNGGWPMATMAGMLGIHLRKSGVYTLGTASRPSELWLMQDAWFFAKRSAWLAWPFFFALALMGARLWK